MVSNGQGYQAVILVSKAEKGDKLFLKARKPVKKKTVWGKNKMCEIDQKIEKNIQTRSKNTNITVIL